MRRREPPPPGPGERDTVVSIGALEAVPVGALEVVPEAAAGVRWRTREAEGSGDPVVYVHGLLASSASWRSVLDGASAGRPAIAVDLPGFGASDRPWPYDYTVDGEARSLLAFLDARGIARAVLVGNSLGGAVVMQVAVTRPERVAALVLVAAATAETPVPWPVAVLRTPVLGELALALSTRASVAIGLRMRIYARASNVTPHAIDDAWLPLTIPGTRRAALAAIRTDPRNFEGLEARVTVPTLVVWGEEDRMIPVREGRRLAERLPNARFAVIQNAGHLPQREEPEKFSEIVREFLAGLSRHPER
jgi:pimeloyl-ACP methyl ester carboxylesterase